MTTTETRPGFRLRWWHFIVTGVIVVLFLPPSVALAYRSAGRASYQALVDELHAQGKPATVDDFVALAPAVDATLQEVFHRWSERCWGGSTLHALSGPHKLDRADWDRWVGGTGDEPSNHRTWLDDRRTLMDEARVMLRTDRLVLSVHGWAAADLPVGRRSLQDVAKVRMPNLMTMREWADWLRCEAVLAQDAEPALRDLDRLVAALQRPACLIDGMIAIAIADIRDRAHLELAVMGKLSSVACESWLHESVNPLHLVADALRHERLLYGSAVAGLLDHSVFRFLNIHDGIVGSRIDGLRIWITGYQDCRFVAETILRVEQRYRRERTDPLPTSEEIRAGGGPLAAITLPNLLECGITAIRADALQRRSRLAVRLIGMAPDLPIDQADLAARLGADAVLLTPPGDRLWLRYERLAVDRFRVTVDPASPIPHIYPASRLASLGKSPAAPASAAYVHAEHGIEIRIVPRPAP